MSRSHTVPRLVVGVAAVCLTVFPSTAAAQVIGPVTLAKVFVEGTVRPGSTATLQFTIANFDPNGSVAADIAFTDDLDAVIPASSLPGCRRPTSAGPAPRSPGPPR